MRPSTIAKIAAALLLALVVAVIAAGKSLNSETYNHFLAERVKAATGLDLTFAGATKLKLGPSPVLSFTGVTLTAGKGGPLLYIDRVEARVALVPLALRQLRLESLTLLRPVLHTQKLSALPQIKPLDLGGASDGTPRTQLALSGLRVEDADIRLSNGTIQVSKAQFTPETEAGGPLSLQVDGRWRDAPLSLSGVIAPLTALGGAKPYPVQIKGSVGTANLTLRGTITQPLAGKGLDLELHAQGEEMSDLLRLRPGKAPIPALGPFKLAARLTDSAGPLAASDIDAVIGRRDSQLITVKGQMADISEQRGVDMALTLEAESLTGVMRLLALDLPNAGQVKLSGHLSDIDNGWRLTGLKSNLGKSDLAGELSLVQTPHPRLYGRLSASQLQLGDFSLPPPRSNGSGQPSQPQHPAIPIDDGRILPIDALALDLVRDLDVDLSLSAARLQMGPAHVSDATAELRVAAGRLSLENFTARSGEGRLGGELRLDTMAKAPALSLRLAGNGLDPAPLTGGSLKGAKADLAFDLKAQGSNLRIMAGSAEGNLALTLGETVMGKDWGGDFPARLSRDLAGAQGPEGLRLRCLVARLPVKAGLVSLDRGLAAETASSAALASGSIDLRSEVLDISVAGRTTPPLRIKGVLGAPILSTEGGGKPLSDAAPCRTAQARRLAR
ncbi:exported protein conserved [Paramagnetospirillum magnetotacticum MS-1]|uniref:Exported protein conserved n=1 Tax=Paramagnetospirillum magnetotacticum MS-1 TaxID=272627 RepID=A0A0C2UEY1_PARME|nr:AsmA family protein [Paramagnetospirillum magnetotacticum]KIM00058.1 exported protein conserved [Paramagnetospirillum magnetotacticum MS-1]